VSAETSNWLHSKIKVGFTKERGNAWWYRLSDDEKVREQTGKSSHYEGAVPVEDVVNDLFNWEAIEVPVVIDVPELTPEGVDTYRLEDVTSKHIVRPRGALGPDDPGGRLATFKNGYNIHQHKLWLLDQLGMILGVDLGIGSAGLLKEGAVAFVQVEVPETITTAEGVAFRPHLLAAGSMNGQLSSTFKRCVQIAVCDNTVDAALGEKGQQVKVRHSKNSLDKLQDVREALAIVYDIGDQFTAEVKRLCAAKVTKPQWSKFLEVFVPEAEEGKESKFGTAMVTKKRNELNRLWTEDERVAPWAGTEFGVLQAVNTFAHHSNTVMGSDRFERNQMNAIKGTTHKVDAAAMKLLAAVKAGE
jgi:phage/plasmid-like protein (TIGR03299 family)